MASAPAVAHADPTPTATVQPASLAARVAAANQVAGTNDMRPTAGSNDPIRPLLVRTVTFRTAPVQTASISPMPALVQVSAPIPVAAPAAPAPVAAQVAPPVAAPPVSMAVPQPPPVQQAAQLPAPVQLPVPAPAQQQRTVVASADPVAAAQVAAPPAQVAAPPAQVAAKVTAPVRANVAAVAAPVVQPVAAPVAQPVLTASAAPVMASADAPIAATIHSHGGWMIQIGAFDDEDQAKQHLSDAQVKVHTALAAADPFTERVQKGDKSLYRARFAGFDKTTAESACKELKRSDFECMTLKD
jgi:D-alanyl-D-alanine carboxypeptidase